MRELARGAMEELRAVVFELRPASLEAEGLATVLRKHVDVLRRVSGRPIELTRRPTRRGCRARARRRCSGSPRRRCRTRCATPTPSASRCGSRATATAALVLSVADDGRGFDPARRAVRGRRLGLTSMEERAEELGGTLDDRVGGGRGHARAARGGGVIRVLIADDHAVVRQGLRTFLDLQDDIDVVGEAADGEEAVAAAAEHAPDVILLDLVMPGLDGIGALRRLREAAPGSRVIVLTSFGEDERLFAALRAGAAGFLLKDVEPAELVRAIRTAHAGQAPLSPAVAARVVEELAHGGARGTPRPTS